MFGHLTLAFSKCAIVINFVCRGQETRNQCYRRCKSSEWSVHKHHLNSPQGHYTYRNRKLQTSKAPLKSQAQGTRLFTSAASNQRGFPIVRGRLRSGCQRVRECVKSEGFSKE